MIWKAIPGYEGRYEVSDAGLVRSIDSRVRLVAQGVETTRKVTGRVLHPAPSRSGHLSVVLGKGNTKGVHTLVLRAFVGPPPAGHEALHLNHTPSDNRLSNLRWGTRAENLRMDYTVGTRTPEASRCASAKINESDVNAIRDLSRVGFLQREIAEHFGVARSTVEHAISGQNWAHVK